MTSLGVDLSQNELVFFLRALNIPALPALTTPLIAADDPMMIAARDALLARQLIAWNPATDPPTLRLDRAVSAMVGTGTGAHAALLLNVEFADGTLNENTWVYFSNAMTVVHGKAEANVHRFIIAQEGETLLAAMMLGLRLSMKGDHSFTSSLTLARHEYDYLIQLAKNGQAEACAQHLIQAGAEASWAYAAAAAFTGAQITRRVILSRVDGVPPSAILVLQTETCYWLISPKVAGKSMEICPGTIADVTETITEIVLAADTGAVV